MAESKNVVGEWIKGNWITLVIWLFTAGSFFGMYTADREKIASLIKENERVVQRLDAYDKQQTENRIFIANNTSRIDSLTLESKQTQQSVGEIKTSIGIINTKMDNVVELLKKQDAKP